MSRTKVRKAILTSAIAAFAAIGVGADWNKTHPFNPSWHPHARYHGVAMLLIVCCVSAIADAVSLRHLPFHPSLWASRSGGRGESLGALTSWT